MARPGEASTILGSTIPGADGRGVFSRFTPSLPKTEFTIVDATTGERVDGERHSRYSDADVRCVELQALTGREFRVARE